MGLKVVTTIRRPDGYEFNVAMDESNLRGWLANASAVLMEGETLSFKRQLPGHEEGQQYKERHPAENGNG